MAKKTIETITVAKEDYLLLTRRFFELLALKRNGVENWEKYESALESKCIPVILRLPPTNARFRHKDISFNELTDEIIECILGLHFETREIDDEEKNE